jgi:hypothetical protein
MRGRLILVGILALTFAACGGSSPSPSPSASEQGAVTPSAGTSASTAPQESTAPATEETSAAPATGSIATAICDAIILRKAASTSASRLKTINSGTAVHVVETVSGSTYQAGSCGTGGDTWLKIDEVGGKSATSAYGVTYVYAAAGFFQ